MTSFEKYLDNYRRGSHCASTALMNICAYYGTSISEDMCFGLGQGLGFSFYKDEKMDMYSFSGRNRDLIRYFFENIGADYYCGYCMDGEELWDCLNYYVLEKEVPVIVKLDMDSMKYLKKKFRSVFKIQQSEHVAVVIDIDENSVTLSEYFDKNPICISKSDFLKGMSTVLEEKACYNVFYAVLHIPKVVNIVNASLIALVNNSIVYRNGFGSNMGLPGLKAFAKNMEIWQENKDNEEFFKLLHMAYFSFEKIGTGGGNFRRIQGRFLRELGKTADREDLVRIGDMYFALSNKWKALSKNLVNYCVNDSDKRQKKWLDIVEGLREICYMEEEATNKIWGCDAIGR